MIVLGLDPSLSGFGWVIHNSDVTGAARVFERGRWSTSTKTLWVKRYMYMREELSKLLGRFLLIEAVGVESPTFGEQWSPGAYALFTNVNEAIYEHRKDVVYWDPQTVKMLAKGDPKVRKGAMFKSDMIEVAQSETGIVKWSSDEADAYNVAKSSARFWKLLRGEIQLEDLTPAEHHAFARVHTFKKGKRAGETVEHGAMFKENARFFRFSQVPK